MILALVSGCKLASEYILSIYIKEYLGFMCGMSEIYWPTIFSSMITSSYRATLLRLGYDQLDFYLPHIATSLACPYIFTETVCLSTVLDNRSRTPTRNEDARENNQLFSGGIWPCLFRRERGERFPCSGKHTPTARSHECYTRSCASVKSCKGALPFIQRLQRCMLAAWL